MEMVIKKPHRKPSKNQNSIIENKFQSKGLYNSLKNANIPYIINDTNTNTQNNISLTLNILFPFTQVVIIIIICITIETVIVCYTELQLYFTVL